jgi:aminoglycoside 3-N-acetyltransferase
MKRCDLHDLKEYLISLRIPKHSTVIIHSSLFKLGIIEGGINSLMNCLKEVFDESYTIAVPAFTFKFATTRQWNYTDSKSETGILCEKVRSLDGSLRSIHPFHSIAAYGPNAEFLTNSICDSSFGTDSAFEKLYKLNAFNMSLGSEFVGGATFCHYTEELLRVPYRFYKYFPGEVRGRYNEIIDKTFNMFVRQIEEKFEYINRWDIFWEDVLKHSLVKYIKFNSFAPVFLMNIVDCHDFLYDKISDNPYYVAEKIIRK